MLKEQEVKILLGIFAFFKQKEKDLFCLFFQKKSISFIKKVEEKDLLKEKDFDFLENLQRKEMKRKGFRPTQKRPQ